MKQITLVLAAALLITLPVQAQKGVNNVHLFQSYFYDAPIANAGYAEGGLMYLTSKQDNPYGGDIKTSAFMPGIQGGYPINDKTELEASLRYISANTDWGQDDKSESGISDLDVYGRYKVYDKKQTSISVGGMLSLPIGSEDVGESTLDFGGFGALRHTLQNGLALAGTLGLFFDETKDEKGDTEHESYLNIGFGGIYPLNPQLNLIGELNLRTEGDYMLLTAGADYLLGSGRVRGALGLGLDDGAPDFLLMGSYSLSLSK